VVSRGRGGTNRSGRSDSNVKSGDEITDVREGVVGKLKQLERLGSNYQMG